jgi:hypothetical protein
MGITPKDIVRRFIEIHGEPLNGLNCPAFQAPPHGPINLDWLTTFAHEQFKTATRSKARAAWHMLYRRMSGPVVFTR